MSARPPDRVGAETLRAFARAIFTRAGMADEHASTVAEVLVWANLRGVDSHGVMRVPRYVELIEAGDMNPRPVIAERTQSPAAVLLDADRAPGPVAMLAGTSAAAARARQAGIGLALVRATTHTAALGYYTQAAARQGLAAVALSASSPNMAYHGARAAGVSTNPISIAVPAGEGEPLLLDMATGMISLGRLALARREGAPIPAGCALDRDGMPTTDARRAAIPLPMAGPKGAGLSLLIECLASLIAGNPLLAESLEGTEQGRRHRQNGLVIAIDVARFCEPATFAGEVQRLARALKALPADPDAGGILLPGERGQRESEARSRNGIPLAAATLAELQDLAQRLGVPMWH